MSGGLLARSSPRFVGQGRLPLSQVEPAVHRGVDDSAPRTLPEILAMHERLIIIEALSRCGGSRTRAAAALGIRRERLYRRMLWLKIDVGSIAAVVTGRPRKSGR